MSKHITDTNSCVVCHECGDVLGPMQRIYEGRRNVCCGLGQAANLQRCSASLKSRTSFNEAQTDPQRAPHAPPPHTRKGRGVLGAIPEQLQSGYRGL